LWQCSKCHYSSLSLFLNGSSTSKLIRDDTLRFNSFKLRDDDEEEAEKLSRKQFGSPQIF